MKKYFIFVLLLTFVNEPLFAGKSYSGGASRSFSSGSRSSGSSFSGRSSSSGSNSSGISGSRSYSSPSTGKSYSSGSHSTPSYSYSVPSSKSYSSGSPKPATPSVNPNYGSNKSYSSGSPKPATPSVNPNYGSNKSYSSGSPKPATPSVNPNSAKSATPSVNPNSAKPATPSVNPNSANPSEKSKQSFSGGNSTNKSPPATNSKKPNSSNSDLSNAAKKEESKIKYQAANNPKPSYTTPKGEIKPIQSNSQPVQTVRNYVTHERYVTYDSRSRSFYSSYYGYPQPYNDFFSPFLMGYLFSSTINSHDRAMWVYNHRDQMDDYRYQQLLEKDAELKARLQILEQQQARKNSNYILPGMEENPDLQYSKEFIDSAYNPVPTQIPNQVQFESSESSESSEFSIFWILIGVILVFAIVYYFAVKEY